MSRALILTYHAIEAGPSPLCVEPALFEAHADVIAQSGVRCVTVRELAATLPAAPREDSVVITFDDGFASMAETAAPILEERGLTATLFCVAGHLGGTNDWPSTHDGSYRSRLAPAYVLAELAAAGFEIGSHGMEHAPLAGAPEPVLRHDVVASRRALEDAVAAPVTSFAYPYGALPGTLGRQLVGETYDAACTTSLGRVSQDSDAHELPRIDAHYLRRPELLKRALEGRLGVYFRARDLAARARRTIVKDYAEPKEAESSLSK